MKTIELVVIEPEWPAFAARMKREFPTLLPNEHDEQWENLHRVYVMGYAACLDILKEELKDELKNLPANEPPKTL